ncbi:MBL fold metallo-hydrolase [Vallitalea maricola]|uniref:Uncharacterized protein n=1 Tax=Vallitalea maricola TaxID=3074433 RepID=A0ACB5URG6_9FIRM|nr:hypothetical protein AN2V17_44670 [Vallitalea sp. AN17-2]
MNYKINPLLWPALILSTPVMIPILLMKNKKFIQNQELAAKYNEKRIKEASRIQLQEVEYAELKVIVEYYAKQGYKSEPGVSYLFTTNNGNLLYDIGFGASTDVFENNLKAFDIYPNNIDALAISHFHPDHCGGMKASKGRDIKLPDTMRNKMKEKTCYVPEKGNVMSMKSSYVEKPQELSGGIVSTGPLARSLFFFGLTQEQALIINIKEKGLVVFTGCGHPTIEIIIDMVRKISDIPIYAIGGGLHFPVKKGRGNYIGVQAQRIIGTGKKPWENINKKDIQRTIKTINECGAKKVFLSPHDTCDYALEVFKEGLKTETYVLKAGESYSF